MPRAHSPELRRAVLNDVPAMGVSGAASKHGIPKGTVSKWANAAGVETVSDERRQIVAGTKLKAEERRAIVAERMWEIADRASQRELDLIEAAEAKDLHSVVGARTRAIHDAELLSGRATSRTETVDVLDAEIAELVREMQVQ